MRCRTPATSCLTRMLTRFAGAIIETFPIGSARDAACGLSLEQEPS